MQDRSNKKEKPKIAASFVQDKLRFLQTLIDAIPIPIFYKDVNGVYLGCNLAFQKCFNLPKEKIVGKTVADIAPKDLADIHSIKDQELFQSKGFQSYESSMIYADGTLHDVIFYKETFSNPDGSLGGLVGVIFDITEHKKIEARLKEARAELGIRVKVRTAELSKANEDLRIEIAQRRKIEKELRKEKEKFSKYLDVAGVIIVVIDADQKVSLINKKGCEILGYNDNEIIGKNWFDNFVPIGIREQARTLFLDLIAGKSEAVGYQESNILTKSGQEKTIVWHNTVLRDDEGKITAALISGEDVTEQKKILEALRISEARYRAIVEDQTELICRWYPDGTLNFVNEAYCRYFGRTREELIGHSFMPLIPVDDWEKVKAHFRSLGKDNPVATHEHRVITPTGEIRWHQWTNRAIFDKHGHIVEFQSVGRDITERKQAEEMQQEAIERFEGIINNTLFVAIQGFDRDGTIIHWNKASEQLYGFNKDEVIGKRLQDILLSGESVLEFQRILHNIWDTGKAMPPRKWEVYNRQKQKRCVYSTMFPIFKKGRVVEVFCMDVDITQEAR